AAAICGNDGSSGVLVAHENCNQFYKCDHGTPVEQICPGTLLFDASKDRCEWPETVSCGDRVIPEGNDNDNENNDWTGGGAGNDDPSQASAICAEEGSNNAYVAHEECGKFYQCWAGQPIPLVCPTGFLFNPKVDYCDFPN
ncbi:hypothetical protein H4F41_24485, partial [Escherichia coli]|nr:hypothetical protein [Escherichia coli]